MAKSENKSADSNDKPKRPAPGPRPAYLAYRIVDASGNEVQGAQLEVTSVVRKADDILAHVTETGDQWTRFLIK